MRITLRNSSLLLLMTMQMDCCGQSLISDSGDWPWWRGPTFNGIAEAGQQPPVAWSREQNIVWKTPVPGRGHSSPTVYGDRIFLTTADDRAKVQSVLAFDRNTGKRLWKYDANHGGFPRKIHRKNTHASPSVACDGRAVFAAFHNNDSIQLVAVDLEGREIWDRVAGKYTPNKYEHGYGASPVLYGSLVIVAGDFDGDAFLVGLDRKTGADVWRVSRPPENNYSSPIVAHVAGRDQLLLGGDEMIASFDPSTGESLWSAKATTMATAGTMVWSDHLVFASGGYPNPETVCVRADGSGEVVWRNNHNCYEQSMLVVGDNVFAVNNSGIALCWRAETGEEQWRHRLRGPFSSSPVLCGDMIYVSNEKGTTWVYCAKPEKFDLIKQNQLGDEAFSTPSICGNRIYLRVAESDDDGERRETLYCIGATSDG